MNKNPPANVGDTGSVPGLGRFYMPESNQACKRSHHNEKPATTTKSRPCLPQLGKAHMQQQRPSTDKDYVGLYLKQPSYCALEYQKLDRNSCSCLMKQATRHRVQAENNWIFHLLPIQSSSTDSFFPAYWMKSLADPFIFFFQFVLGTRTVLSGK